MIAKSVENLRNWKVNKLRINKEKVIQSNTSNNNPVVMNLNEYLHIQCIRNVMEKKYLKNSTRHCKWENSLPILHFKNADLGFHKLLSRSVLEVKNCSWARGHDIYLQCRCMKVIWASILTAIDPTLSRDFFFLRKKTNTTSNEPNRQNRWKINLFLKNKSKHRGRFHYKGCQNEACC